MRVQAEPDRATLVDVLRDRADGSPDATAFEFVADDGTESPVSYAALDSLARSVAAALLDRCPPGARALIVCPPGEQYVVAFLGCMYAGVTAVPVYPPITRRGAERAMTIAADADAAVALSDSATAAGIAASYSDTGTGGVDWLITDELPADADWTGLGPRADQLALLQYTSGSTGLPKGVMVTHANLMANSATISGALGLGRHSRGVSWLPPYHDLGLIGGIIQPIFAGFPCTLLSPLAFLRRPACWLEALSRHRATISAAPDFGYLDCARRISPGERTGLDLSGWRHALVGAEPVRAATLEEFARTFAVSGFRRSAFYPCYGLAEATLFATGPGAHAVRPRLLGVDRAELTRGRVKPVGPDHPEPATVLTSLGRGHGADRVLVVDPDTHRPCPPRTVGEIWLTGPCVTAGYWRRDEESAHSFGAQPAGQPGSSYLRTGDLGFQHRSELFITGRIKDLMIVRGRNHYPSDVEETAGRAHVLLKPGRAAAFTVDDGAQELLVLVHEVVRGFGEEDGRDVTRAIMAAVSAEHGLRLHEATLVRAGSIPRTTSGKIMRASCRDRWLAGSLAVVYSGASGYDAAEPASDEAQKPDEAASALARITAESLGSWPAPLPADVPLVSLGLDSLRSVRLMTRLEDLLGLQVSVPELLGGVTLADLRARLGASGDAHRPPQRPAGAPDVRTADAPADTAATPAQHAMWLLDRMGAGAAYHVAASVRLRGALHPDALHECLDELIRRHPALRSSFVPAADGTLRVTLRPAASLPLPLVDLRGVTGDTEREAGARREIDELARAPFDLTTGPLLRAVLIRLAADDWRLGVIAHHIAVDGWSLSILARQLGETYRALRSGAPMPTLTAQHGDANGRESAAAADEAFWKRTLAGAQAVELPVVPAAPEAPSWRGAWLPVELSANAVSRLRAIGTARAATPVMVLLAGLAAALARWSGQDDLVIGTPAAGRDRPGTADLVGLLVNTMPVRISLSGDPSFGDLISRVAAACLAAYPHQALAFDRIVRAAGARRAGARAPLVRVLLAMQNMPEPRWRAAGVQADATELPAPGAQFELSLHLREQPDGSMSGHASYAADLIDPQTVQGVLDSMRLIMWHGSAAPGTPVTDLPALTSAERDLTVNVLSGAGLAPLSQGLVADLIAVRADGCPDVPAVVSEQQTLSYRELAEHASRLARYLRDLGVSQEQPVAVCLRRSASLMIALLAVLESGGAYVPLDPSYPPGRLAHLLADTRPVVVLTSSDLVGDGIPLTEPATVICLDQPIDALRGYPAGRPANVADPVGLAYVIHTSGSTGTPKGVMSTHAGFANRLAWMQSAFPLGTGEAVLHKTPIGFDVSGWELFWPLIAGATTVLARPDGHRDPLYLSRLIRDRTVTTCHFVPSMLRAFLADPASSSCATTLRRVICSGEELPPDLAARFFDTLPGVELHNLYGPTEAAIDVTAHAVTRVPGLRVPIGRPIAGAQLHVLDRRGHPVPRQVEGELHIGGIPLARGYLHQPARTAERFVPDPFTTGARLYRTGDRARWLSDGALEYLGRLDRQVKIRGHRIEPAEIESALARHPAVAAAAVDVRQGGDHEPRLVAYVVPAAQCALVSSEMRGYLADRLPAPMLPAAFVMLDSLPIGQNGKLDRALLPEPADSPAAAGYVAPRDQVERRLAEFWCEALGRDLVSVTDDFFDLGGDSLLATKIVTRIRFDYGVEIPVEDFLSGALTIESLARSLRQHQVTAASPQDLSATMAWLDGLTDEEVAKQLAKAASEGAG